MKENKYFIWAMVCVAILVMLLVSFMYFFGYRIHGEIAVYKEDLPYGNLLIYIYMAIVSVGAVLIWLFLDINHNDGKVEEGAIAQAIIYIVFALLLILGLAIVE